MTPERPALNVNFERLRVLGALGIVCFHTQSGTISSIGYAGLPVFILITIMLSVRREPAPFGAFVKSKAARLLLPWAAWVLIYLASEIAITVVRHEPIDPVLGRINPFFGTQVILWYLPFAFAALLLTQRLHGALLKLRGGLGLVGALALAAFLVAVVPWLLGDPSSLPAPAPQFVFATPGVLWGMSMGYARELGRRQMALGLGLSVVGVFLGGVLLLAIDEHHGAIDLLLAYGIGLPLVCLAVLWPGERLDAMTRWLAPLTYGIYLDHALANLVLYRIPGYAHDNFVMGVLILFAAAAVMTAIFKKVPLVKRIV